MNNHKIAIIGQGYVGLSLGLAFSTHYDVWGYDIDATRIVPRKLRKRIYPCPRAILGDGI